VDDFMQNLSAENISEVKISAMPEQFKEFETNDSESIEKIVDYLRGLNIPRTISDVYDGGGYHMEFTYDNGDKSDVTIAGNKCIIINRQCRELEYEEAVLFGELAVDILHENYRANYPDTFLAGTISYLSEPSANSERVTEDQICMIDSSNEKIDITNSYIYDVTGSDVYFGKGTTVEIFYKRNSENNNRDLWIDGEIITVPLTADAIFITKENGEIDDENS
jgi:hypothetical protein